MLPNWLVTHGAALALGAAVSWWFTDLAADAAASKLQAAAQHERAEAFRWVASEQKRSAAEMAVADTQALAEIRREQEETDKLRDCIERGNGCGLRVRVVRADPAKCDGVPEAGATPGVGDRGGEWAELAPTTGRGYFALRRALKERDKALALCVSQWPR